MSLAWHEAEKRLHTVDERYDQVIKARSQKCCNQADPDLSARLSAARWKRRCRWARLAWLPWELMMVAPQDLKMDAEVTKNAGVSVDSQKTGETDSLRPWIRISSGWTAWFKKSVPKCPRRKGVRISLGRLLYHSTRSRAHQSLPKELVRLSDVEIHRQTPEYFVMPDIQFYEIQLQMRHVKHQLMAGVISVWIWFQVSTWGSRIQAQRDSGAQHIECWSDSRSVATRASSDICGIWNPSSMCTSSRSALV